MNSRPSPLEMEIDRLEAELPWLDRTWSKSQLLLARVTRSPRSLVAAFEKESTRVAKILDSHDYGILSQEVEIPRMTGIRGGSCKWSILMVIGHLNQYTDFLLAAISDRVSGMEATTEYRYFDPGDPDGDCVALFQENAWHFVGTMNNLIEKGGLSQATGTLMHPLYDSVDAKSLMAIAWLHVRLHRRQIQKILAVEGVV